MQLFQGLNQKLKKRRRSQLITLYLLLANKWAVYTMQQWITMFVSHILGPWDESNGFISSTNFQLRRFRAFGPLIA
jgi:hypothetical protein